MLSVALNEHETQRQGEQQNTCHKRFETYAALYQQFREVERGSWSEPEAAPFLA